MENASTSVTPGGVSAPASGAEASGRRGSSSNPSDSRNNRILCPVEGCLESLASSSKNFLDFPSIKSHLDDHCSGQLMGAVPIGFIHKYDYTF